MQPIPASVPGVARDLPVPQAGRLPQTGQWPGAAGGAGAWQSQFFGALYALTNQKQNKIKRLMGEDNGVVLYYEPLAEGRSDGRYRPATRCR